MNSLGRLIVSVVGACTIQVYVQKLWDSYLIQHWKLVELLAKIIKCDFYCA